MAKSVVVAAVIGALVFHASASSCGDGGILSINLGAYTPYDTCAFRSSGGGPSPSPLPQSPSSQHSLRQLHYYGFYTPPSPSPDSALGELLGMLPTTAACRDLYDVVSGSGFTSYTKCGYMCVDGKKKDGAWCTIPTSWISYGWPAGRMEVCCGNFDSCCEEDVEALSGGAIAGIVIAIIVGIVGGFLGCYFGKCCCFSYRKQQGPPQNTAIQMTQPGQVLMPEVQMQQVAGGGNPTYDGNVAVGQHPVAAHHTAVEMPAAATPTLPDLKSWLDEHKLGHIEAKLREYGVSAVSDLNDLDESDLDSAGIKKLDKKKLTKALEK